MNHLHKSLILLAFCIATIWIMFFIPHLFEAKSEMKACDQWWYNPGFITSLIIEIVTGLGSFFCLIEHSYES